METVIFEDNAGNKVMLDTDDRVGREAYLRQWQENRTQLENIAARRNIGIIDLHTNSDVYDDLLLGLRRINIGKSGR
jgi:uncharacterized protein (DUF58 family)